MTSDLIRQESNSRIAILFPGNREQRQNASQQNNRFANLFSAFSAAGVQAEPAVYHDDFCEEVRAQLLCVDGVLVWVNPIEGGRDRSVVDSMLRDVSDAGIFVGTHPDVILKLGTKEVLYETRDLGWGCDTHLYRSIDEMRRDLPAQLSTGKARVLKQYRGNGGDGVWKIQLPSKIIADEKSASASMPKPETIVRVRHAKRGCVEEEITLREFIERCEQYFSGNGIMIDQEFQERLADGMVRCYLVHDKVAGFGHQAINALFPAPEGAPPEEAPQPGPRLHHPPTMAEFQNLKDKLENEWVAAAQRILQIETEDLPVLWDCDFLLGPKQLDGADSYVLCEINVSSVAPFPESAIPYIVDATLNRIRSARSSGRS